MTYVQQEVSNNGGNIDQYANEIFILKSSDLGLITRDTGSKHTNRTGPAMPPIG